MTSSRKCIICENLIKISDNMIENQVNKNLIISNLCLSCCKVDPSLELIYYPPRKIYQEFAIANLIGYDPDFRNEEDCQKILHELHYGVTRDLVCYYGKLYQRNQKGAFVIRIENNQLIMSWKENITYFDQTDEDICILFIIISTTQDTWGIPYLLSKFLCLDNAKYRRALFEVTSTFKNVTYPSEINQILRKKKREYKKFNFDLDRKYKSLNKTDMKRILQMYHFRCDVCGILVDENTFSMNKLENTHETPYLYETCRLTCDKCDISIDEKIARL
jgi:hypothetical protein